MPHDRNITRMMLLAALSAGCVSVPTVPSNVVEACGLEPRDGWALLAGAPEESTALLEIMRLDYRQDEPDPSRTYTTWLTGAAGTRLAYCQYTGQRSCGFGSTATFHQDAGGWRQDDHMILHVCSGE